ncbi:MAG: hypothetical protein ACKVRO_10245 [Micropepsaceae bacterium]
MSDYVRLSLARVLAGFAMAPLVPSLALFLVSMATGSPARESFLFALFSSALGYLVTIVIGVPLFLLLRSSQLNSFTTYAVSGIAIGLAVLTLLLPPSAQWVYETEHSKSLPYVAFLLLFAGYGFLAAAAFWLIARPDRRSR